MAILEVTPENSRQLQNIANTLAAAKKIIVFTGAGISTNCGIPVGLKPRSTSTAIANFCFRTFALKKDSTLSYKPNATLFPCPQPLAMLKENSPAPLHPPQIQNKYLSQFPTTSKAKISSTPNCGRILSARQSSMLSLHPSAKRFVRMSREPRPRIALSGPSETRASWSDATRRTLMGSKQGKG